MRRWAVQRSVPGDSTIGTQRRILNMPTRFSIGTQTAGSESLEKGRNND